MFKKSFIFSCFLVFLFFFASVICPSIIKTTDSEGYRWSEWYDNYDRNNNTLLSNSEDVNSRKLLKKDATCSLKCTKSDCVFDEEDKEICECWPEHGKISKTKCKECNCGKESNCTISSTWFGDSIKCICKDGYEEIKKKCTGPCYPDPCKNGGVCKDENQTYRCECVRGYFGRNCTLKGPCFSNPCQNGGLCKNINDIKYKCECDPKYAGDNCEMKSQCYPDPCENKGVCKEENQTYRCECPKGYLGKNCSLKDTCHNRILCKNGGECYPLPENKFYCRCVSGYRGLTCEEVITTTDFSKELSTAVFKKTDPCEEIVKTELCGPSTKCIKTDGLKPNPKGQFFNCSCATGYYAKRHYQPIKDEESWVHVCEDINECLRAFSCPENTSCLNTPGSYECFCDKGFKKASENIKENGCIGVCDDKPCGEHGGCVEVDNHGYTCKCNIDYAGLHCDVPNETFHKLKHGNLRDILIVGGVLGSLLLVIFSVYFVIYRGIKKSNGEKNKFKGISFLSKKVILENDITSGKHENGDVSKHDIQNSLGFSNSIENEAKQNADYIELRLHKVSNSNGENGISEHRIGDKEKVLTDEKCEPLDHCESNKIEPAFDRTYM